MKRENGYLLIDDLTFIKESRIGASSIGWYTDGKEEYLFKSEERIESYREIFYPLIIQELGLKTVENDLAKNKNHLGIISKNYNSNHDKEFLLSEIYFTYYQKNSWDSKYFSLEKIEEIIKYFAYEKKIEYAKDIMNDLYNQFIIQVLLGNSDLNCGNMSVILKDKLIMSPFYDFEKYGRAKSTNWHQNSFEFQAETPLDDYPIPFQKTIKGFLNYASKEKIELFREYLETIKAMNIDKKINLIEEKTEHHVPLEISFKLKRELKSNIKCVDKTLRKLGANK